MPEDTTTPCHWYEDVSCDYWVAECEGRDGSLWMFAEGGPVDNHMTFCGYCGKPIEIVDAPDTPVDAVDLVN